MGAEVDTQDAAVEILPLSKLPRNETRAASHIQHVVECARRDAIKIFLYDLQKNRLPCSILEPIDNDIQRLCVQFIRSTVDIGHGRPPSYIRTPQARA
jgi:hypothetical protein